MPFQTEYGVVYCVGTASAPIQTKTSFQRERGRLTVEKT
jgi:hypothetical protein